MLITRLRATDKPVLLKKDHSMFYFSQGLRQKQSLLTASIFVLLLMTGCIESTSTELKNSSIVGEWEAFYQSPGLGQIHSTYQFDSNGAAGGTASTRDGVSAFLGTWSTSQKQAYMSGKRMTIVGSSNNSIDIKVPVNQVSSNQLEIEGVIHARR